MKGTTFSKLCVEQSTTNGNNLPLSIHPVYPYGLIGIIRKNILSLPTFLNAIYSKCVTVLLTVINFIQMAENNDIWMGKQCRTDA